MWSSAPTKDGEAPSTTRASGAERSVCGADGRDGWESRQRSSPKGPSTPDNPSVTAAPCQLPLHKGALETGDADCRVGPAGLLAMTTVFCHSEERSDVGIRPFYDGRGFGPPRSSAPTPCGGTGVRHAGSSCPTGGCGGLHQLPGGAGAQRSACDGGARNGSKSGKRLSTKGMVAATAGAALSEAESAEIAAGQIRFLPDDLRVQHGARGSEVW